MSKKPAMEESCAYCGHDRFVSVGESRPGPGLPGYGWGKAEERWVCGQCGQERGAAVVYRLPVLVVGPDGPICPVCSELMPMRLDGDGLGSEFVSCPCGYSIHRAQLKPSPELAAARQTRQACPRCNQMLRASFPEFFEGTHPICDGCGYPNTMPRGKRALTSQRSLPRAPQVVSRSPAPPPPPPPPAPKPEATRTKARARLRPPGKRQLGANAPERIRRWWAGEKLWKRQWEAPFRGERTYAPAPVARHRDVDSMQARVLDDVLVRHWLMAGRRVRYTDEQNGPFELEDALGILRSGGPSESGIVIPGEADNARWLFCGGSLEHLDRWWKLQADFVRRTRWVYPGRVQSELGELVDLVSAALDNYEVQAAVAYLEDGLPGAVRPGDLLDLARLHAPFVPHMAEALYRNLLPCLPPGAPPSVHLAPWPAIGADHVWFTS